MATKSMWVNHKCGHEANHKVSGHDGKAIDRKVGYLADEDCPACVSAAAVAAGRVDYGEWRHPRTGEVRRYINNLPELLGIDRDDYTKAWLDESGELHHRNLGPGHAETLTEAIAHG